MTDERVRSLGYEADEWLGYTIDGDPGLYMVAKLAMGPLYRDLIAFGVLSVCGAERHRAEC